MEARKKRSKGQSHDSPENAQRAARRARTKLRDIALCNGFSHFVTLTFSPERVARYDDREVMRKLRYWCENEVKRTGLRYVLVPERHKDGAIHLHGFMAWDGEPPMVDSGTLANVPGHKKPVRPRSERQRREWLAHGARPVYNLWRWRWGFSTAMGLYGDYHQAVTYVSKYIGKNTEGGEVEKIGGRWYYHGNCPGEPVVQLSNQSPREYENLPGAYSFAVPEAGRTFVRYVGGKKNGALFEPLSGGVGE